MPDPKILQKKLNWIKGQGVMPQYTINKPQDYFARSFEPLGNAGSKVGAASKVPWYKAPIGQAVKGTVTKGGTQGLAKTAGSLLGKVPGYMAAGQVGGSIGDAARRALGSNDPYYNSPYPTMSWGIPQFQNWGLPDPTMFYNQGGYAQLTGKTNLRGTTGGMTPEERAQYIKEQIAAKQQGTQGAGSPTQPSGTGFPNSAPPQGYQWVWDSSSMQYVLNPINPNQQGETAAERAYKEAQAALANAQAGNVGKQNQYAQFGQNPYDDPNTPQQEGQWNPYKGEWEAPPGWISPFQQQQIDYQKQQDQMNYQLQQQQFQWQQQQAQMQLEAQKQQQLANLRANPASWLEYASLAGQTPTVQPWMVPLGQAGQGLKVGQALPGYQSQGNSMNLPELTSPSAQYISSIAPSAREQYYGYEKARTGANPQDVSWLLGNRAPPSGWFSGLRRTR